MPKGKKTFLKIKKKLVFVTPKKFSWKKFAGIVCVIIGTLLWAYCAFVLFASSRQAEQKAEVTEKKTEKVTFSVKRILFPSSAMNFKVEGDKIIGDFPLKIKTQNKPKVGEEILVFGEKEFFSGKIIAIEEVDDPLGGPFLNLNEEKVKVMLPVESLKEIKILTLYGQRK